MYSWCGALRISHSIVPNIIQAEFELELERRRVVAVQSAARELLCKRLKYLIVILLIGSVWGRLYHTCPASLLLLVMELGTVVVEICGGVCGVWCACAERGERTTNGSGVPFQFQSNPCVRVLCSDPIRPT